MGANEKFDAAMHRGFDPVTESVCERFMHDRYMTDGVNTDQSRAEFDRWLDRVRAEAKAEALTEMAHVLEADIPGHAHENGQIIAGRNIIRIIRARANQYKEAPSA